MKNILLIIILFFSVQVSCQNIPLPQRCYPLNNDKDIMTGKQAEIQGKVNFFSDRFGVAGNAICLDKNIGIQVPLLADSLLSQGVTITFWYYADQIDAITQCFVAKDINGHELLGMQSNNGRAVLNLYHYTHSNILSTDRQWMWDDCKFNATGWYQIVIVYDTDCTKYYMFDSKNKLTQCPLSFVPDWKLVSSFCIGGGNTSLFIDDFKIYSTALSEKEICLLNDSESHLNMGPVKLLNRSDMLGVNRECILSTNDDSSWYLHFAGKNAIEGYNYYIQHADELTYLSDMDQKNIALEQFIFPFPHFWNILPVNNDMNEVLYKIVDDESGLYLTACSDKVTLNTSANDLSQQWYMGLFHIIPTNIQKVLLQGEKANVFWEEQNNMIHIHVNLGRSENMNVSLFSETGVLLKKWNLGCHNQIEKSIPVGISPGTYIVCLRSATVNINKKIVVSENQ